MTWRHGFNSSIRRVHSRNNIVSKSRLTVPIGIRMQLTKLLARMMTMPFSRRYSVGAVAEKSASARYSPSKITSVTTEVIKGDPDPKHISTSFC